jgi:hypothetical protein
MSPRTLVGFVLVSGLTGILVGVAFTRPVPRTDHVVALADVTKRLDDLNERITQLAASRCMTVNTPVLNVSVYDAGNLGTAKVKEKKP